MEHIDRYEPIVRELAEKALGMAIDGSPTRPAAGQRVVSLMAWVPVAQALLTDEPYDGPVDALVSAIADPQTRLVDGLGHHRPIYRALAWHVLRASAAKAGPAPVLAADGFHEAWWQRWMENGTSPAAVSVPEGDGPLHQQTLDDAPEDWTYRDLAALHAMAHFAVAMTQQTPDAGSAWLARCGQAARFHQDHTQPDYTTYQPWGLPAFLFSAETVFFAEQQLHDTQTHLHVAGPSCALVPALLLADSCNLLRTLLRTGQETG